MILASTLDFKSVTVLCVVIAFIAVLAYRLLNKDPNVRKTRWGFFVERVRYDDERGGAPARRPPVQHVDPADADTKIDWPERTP